MADMSTLSFSKMQGLGNDFVVIDAVRQSFTLTGARARLLADRHRGVGCDQILLLEKARDDAHDFHYRIFNADGTEVSQCGNGARCITRFAQQQGLTNKTTLTFSTQKGSLVAQLTDNGQVAVNMGEPTFPDGGSVSLSTHSQAVDVWTCELGNPHAVLRYAALDDAPIATLGAAIERHPYFPEGVNVGFMQIHSPSHIALRVYERGAGETLACGSGACAAVACGIQHGVLDKQVTVTQPGGDLVIAWQGPGSALWMTGPAEHVFDGTVDVA